MVVPVSVDRAHTALDLVVSADDIGADDSFNKGVLQAVECLRYQECQ